MVSKICPIQDCERKSYKRGMCSLHYQRWRRHGDATFTKWGRTPSERFWSHVDKSGDCWEWTGGKSVDGYGRFRIGQKKLNAHRVSYEMVIGSIPQGMQIDHMCHNPACVNPAHLRAVTQKENQENHSGPRRDSTSGIRGVNWHKGAGKWVARVRHNGRLYAAGRFDSITDAEQAVVAKRLELHTHNDLDKEIQ